MKFFKSKLFMTIAVGVLWSCSGGSQELESFEAFCRGPDIGQNEAALEELTSADICDMEAGTYLEPNQHGVHNQIAEIDHSIAVSACREAVGLSPESDRLNYQLARALLARVTKPAREYTETEFAVESRFVHDSETFAEATIVFERLAAEDHANAMAWSGIINQDEEIMRKAASLGSPIALGFLYDECSRDPRNSPEKCFRIGVKAHNAGHFMAGYEIAFALSGLQLTEESETLVIDFLEGAADYGNPFALNALVSIYAEEKPFKEGVRFGGLNRPNQQLFEHWFVRKLNSRRFPYGRQVLKHFDKGLPQDASCRSKIIQMIAPSS